MQLQGVGYIMSVIINPLAPNDIYMYMSYRTANLQTLHFKYLLTEYFKHAAHSPFFFIMLYFLVPVIFIF